MKIVPDTHDGVFTDQEDETRREKLMDMALMHGAKVGAGTLVVSSIAAYVANQRIPFVRNYASINGKVSVPLIVAMFVTSVVTELGIHDAKTHPEKWDGGKPFFKHKAITAEQKDPSNLNIGKQLLLKVYDHPLVFAALCALPVAGKIMATRFAKSHLSMSQALMQTRVFAQFGVISILMSTVSIRAIVEANDHFGCRHVRMTDDDRYARGWATEKHNA